MLLETDTSVLTRRRLLAWTAGLTGLCGRTYAFASDFWNKKGPADWSSDEVHQLLNKSPWAKPVTAEMAKVGGGGNRAGGGGNGGGMGGGGNRAGGMGGGGGRNGGMGGGGMGGAGRGVGNTGDMGSNGSNMPRAVQQAKGVVRWESAKPVLEASKGKLPDPLANHDVISVIGFPIGGRRTDSEDGGAMKLSNAMQERIKAATSLTPKGKDAVHPDVVQLSGFALLLGFAQDSVKLTPDDKEVAFATLIGRMAIKTKFNFKEMMYHETLAI